MKKTIYVCGFAFNYDRKKVVLIMKNKPKWQQGFLNGVGGHVNDGEEIQDAMRREFLEETGVDVWAWNIFCQYEGKDYTVHFLKAFTAVAGDVKSITDEIVGVYDIDKLNNETNNGLSENRTIPNLKWLIPLALDIRIDKANCLEY
jgi:8-oxo-dGTP diphosphatase